MIKTLKPIYNRESYSESTAKNLLQQLYDLLFLPIFHILDIKAAVRINSIADLKKAIRSAKLVWQDGFFYGEFNSIVGKALRDLGAKFDSKRKAYKLDIAKIPNELRTDIAIGSSLSKNKTDAILKHLQDAESTKIVLGDSVHPVSIMDELNIQTVKTFKVLPEHLQIPFDLTAKQKESLSKDYNNNLELYINDWKQQQIERLREKTEKNAQLGYRADRLAKIVKSEFQVSENKAKFLARQETALFVSKYREQRYSGAGIKSYIWSTSHDERVRRDHADLNGLVFSWDNPPIVDKTTGRKGNPGEDYGCRCVALPVIRLGV